MLKFRLSFLLLPLIAVLLYFGWKRWSATLPQPLPQKASVEGNEPILSGSYYEASVPPTGTAKYVSADYRLWIPDGLDNVRGLLVKQHGCQDWIAATGLDHANDLQWQALALKHQFALLAPKLPTGDRICDDWAIIDRGSEDAFFKAVRTLAKKSQHPELNKVPWALWGHSGGADWVAQMMQKYPERTIAVVAMRCGAVTFPDTNNSALFGVPVLFAVAEKENTLIDECRDLPKRVFLRYRKAGAIWSVAEHANTSHEAGDTRLLAIPYLDAIMTARLPLEGMKLRAINMTQGWLGNTATHAITPVSQYKENPLLSSWLPNEETARKWQQYVTTGKISPTQKPAAPTKVQTRKTGATEVLLTWHFTPDLENGLPSFRIYRNNTLIKTLQGQQHSFGDAPEPPQVSLEFQDKHATPNSTYTVAAFNDLGESVSQPTQPIENKGSAANSSI